MTPDWLVLGTICSVPLTFTLLSLAFDLASRRARRRGRVVGILSKAEKRGQALLNEWLSPEQRATLARHGSFEVRGSHSGKRYRIHPGRNMNIEELANDGGKVAFWCFGPAWYLPLGDVMLAQKLALETDEQAALAVANRARR